MNPIKKIAYKIVFNDLITIPIINGKYDTKNGNEHFMYGVHFVMKTIECLAE